MNFRKNPAALATVALFGLAATSRAAFTDLPAKNFGFIDNSPEDHGGGSGGVTDQVKKDGITGAGTDVQQQQAQIGEAKDGDVTLAKGSYAGGEQQAQTT